MRLGISMKWFGHSTIALATLWTASCGDSGSDDQNVEPLGAGGMLGLGGTGQGGAVAGAPQINGSGGAPAASGGAPNVAAGGSPIVGGMGGTSGAGTAGTPPETGGVSPSGGSQGTFDGGPTGTGGQPPDETCVMGSVSASQVIFIGDSYPASGATAGGIGGIQAQIEARAVEAGVLQQGTHYRNYYVGGTRFLNNTIQSQYDKAKAENPDIKVVIMNGGGNDVLQGLEGCSILDEPSDQNCIDVVERSTAASAELMRRMQSDGITQIVYYFYPEVPLAQGHSAFDEPYAREACEAASGPLYCYFVSTIAAFDGHADYIGADGIHPTATGQKVIGDLVWDSMVGNCVAQ